MVDRSAQPSPVAEEQDSRLARRQSWQRLFTFLGLSLLGLVIAILACHSVPDRARVPFDARLLARLKAQKPKVVLIGNSMVDTRFDEPTLRRYLPDARVAVLGMAATKSAVWYLVMKNIVAPSGAHPRVVQFFRANELTEPSARASGWDHGKLERVSREDDPLVERKIAPPLSKPMARLAWYRDRLLPFSRLHEKTAPWLDSISVLVSGLFWPEPNRDVRMRSINRLFSLADLRDEKEPVEQGEPQPAFEDVVEASFLPDMCELSREQGLPLTFIRVRTRFAASGGRDTPAEQRYVASLERYVRACGAEFYDMQDATWESLDMFGNGDHISGRDKRKYTALFAARMRQVFH